MEMVSKEVPAGGGLKVSVGEVIHGLHAVAKELDGQSRRQSWRFGQDKVAFGETNQAHVRTLVETSVRMATQVFPGDESHGALRVVDLGSASWQLVGYSSK